MINSTKMLVKIINNRLQNKIERQLGNAQFKFRRNKGTREEISSLGTLIEKQIEFNKDTFIPFNDLGKAFDTVPRKKFLKHQKKVVVDYKDRWIINNLYKKQSVIIQVSDKSITTKIKKEVKQRYPLSPILINIYIEQFINEIKETLIRDKIGLIVEGELISLIRFADDIALFVKIAKVIQKEHQQRWEDVSKIIT